MQAIVRGAEVLYLFPDSATIVGRQVTVAGAITTMSDSGSLATIPGVILPAGTPPFICDYLAGVVSINAARQATYLAQQAAISAAATAPNVSIISASYAAGLRRQADALNAQGKSYEAVQLLLKAQRISP